MPRIVILILLMVVVGCTTNTTPEPPANPDQLLQEAANNILGINSLKMLVERTGADYILKTDIGDAIFQRIEVQYVAPGTVQARAKVTLAGLPAEIEIFAKDEEQWWRPVGLAWQKMIFLPGFNPRALLQEEDRGLRAAIRAMKDATLNGETQLEDGTPVYELAASADGDEVSWLMLYVIQITGQVKVNMFIDKTNRMPQKFVIVQPETATQTEGPTTWTIEIYDFNAEPSLTPPG